MRKPARVLIVDDSRLYRAAIEEALKGLDDVVVAGSVFSGARALEFLRASPVDVVTLDVEMPGMDGLEALRGIQELNATRPPEEQAGVIMVSAFTRRGAEVTVRALEAGAFDFVEKPRECSPEANVQCLRAQLSLKIRLYQCRRGTRAARAPSPSPPPPGAARRAAGPVRAIAIGVSTGGPQALAQLIGGLDRCLEQPIFIVQHMPAEFTGALAGCLGQRTGRVVQEAVAGTAVQPGGIYLAPGGRHLLVRATANGEVRLALSEQCHECGCRPSANVLFRSAAAAYGKELAAVVLTGMGNDGAAALAEVKRAGGLVIAQDEATSVVWGMPQSAIATGHVDEVLPLPAIAGRLNTLCKKR